MPRVIDAISEFYTDQIVDLGSSAREIHLHMKVHFADGQVEWHYYGTPIPDPAPALPAVQHPAVRFPFDINNMPDTNGLLFDMAGDYARHTLQL